MFGADWKKVVWLPLIRIYAKKIPQYLKMIRYFRKLNHIRELEQVIFLNENIIIFKYLRNKRKYP